MTKEQLLQKIQDSSPEEIYKCFLFILEMNPKNKERHQDKLKKLQQIHPEFFL